MSLRKRYEAIEAAKVPGAVWSKKHFIEKYGHHPGGPVEQAKEDFALALIDELERLQREVARLSKPNQQHKGVPDGISV